MKKKSSGLVGYLIVAVIVGGLSLFLYDLLFSPPDHFEGVITEKIFVPSKSGGGGSFGATRRGNYYIKSEQDEQWVAMVKMETGDTVKVHLQAKHYGDKNVGDHVHFKKYEGHLFHIEYLAHSEEED